jgi:Mg2+ and Co2+ transporter CorA
MQEYEVVEEVLAFAKTRKEQLWLNIEAITANEMDALGEAFNIDDVTRNDCVFEDTSISDEKWESFDSYLFVIADILRSDRPQTDVRQSLDRGRGSPIPQAMLTDHLAATFRSPQKPGSRPPERITSSTNMAGFDNADVVDRWHTENINVILFDDCVLSLHNYPFPRLQSLISRVQQEKSTASLPSLDWILYAILGAALEGRPGRRTLTAPPTPTPTHITAAHTHTEAGGHAATGAL